VNQQNTNDSNESQWRARVSSIPFLAQPMRFINEDTLLGCNGVIRWRKNKSPSAAARRRRGGISAADELITAAN
jgi:hypothetical protein